MDYKHTDSQRINPYFADDNRYEDKVFRRCGRSGLILPALSLGLWHNFGDVDDLVEGRKILRKAFDSGITHFDLANNYGPPYGAAEIHFGSILKKDFLPYRDELIISTKAGYDMWDGPYGNWGSRKYLMASINQSLKRMGLEYVDIFYHHRPDPKTPLEETMLTLDHIVKQGKALYVGISNYDDEQTLEAAKILKDLKTPFVIHQAKYSMLNRWIEPKLIARVKELRLGLICFSPLAEGVLTEKYVKGIPKNSRAAKQWGHLQKDFLSERIVSKVKALNQVAQHRGQSLAQMALAWVLRHPEVTSVLIGASSVKQLTENLKTFEKLHFTQEELQRIELILNEE